VVTDILGGGGIRVLIIMKNDPFDGSYLTDRRIDVETTVYM